MKSFALLLVALLGADASQLLRKNTDDPTVITKRQRVQEGDDNRKALFQDDENFWNRQVLENTFSLACVADGGMLECPECCFDATCIPCIPVCVEDGGDIDCGDDCCENGGCVPCQCLADGGDIDCSNNPVNKCCEDGQCIPCPPVCPEDGGDLDCSSTPDRNCCENGQCIKCPECIMELNIDCPDCFKVSPTPSNCLDRPLEITMLYAGGSCALSRNCQEDKFECEDFNGGPPEGIGSTSYIVATDDDEEDVYFEGWVDTYSVYTMTNNMERFPADQTIKVYASDNTEDPSQLLQSVTYHSSCSQNLDLLNRFGSQVIYGWFNEEQGYISGATNSTFSVTVDIPISAVQILGEEDATITGLYVAKTSTTTEGEVELDPEFFDLTDAVYGSTVGDGGTFVGADVAIPLNLAVEQDVTFLITMEAETASGVDCTAIELLEFTAGGTPLGLGSENECPDSKDEDE